MKCPVNREDTYASSVAGKLLPALAPPGLVLGTTPPLAQDTHPSVQGTVKTLDAATVTLSPIQYCGRYQSEDSIDQVVLS